MAKSTDILVICATLILLSISSSSSSAIGIANGDNHHHQLGWLPTTACRGSMEECEAEEFGMESEISRRILATTRYISYGALSRNSVPCSRRGASYYNCRAGAQSNPYSRGCSSISRCRR